MREITLGEHLHFRIATTGTAAPSASTARRETDHAAHQHRDSGRWAGTG
jgi:hypothetical protein